MRATRKYELRIRFRLLLSQLLRSNNCKVCMFTKEMGNWEIQSKEWDGESVIVLKRKYKVVYQEVWDIEISQ